MRTRNNFILTGFGIGLDLWIFEIFSGYFLMYHDTKVSLRACLEEQRNMSGDFEYSVEECEYSPKDVYNLDEQSYSGFALGRKFQSSIVFLQTDNWRISMESSMSDFYSYMDSNFKQVKFRSLNYFPRFKTDNQLGCDGYYASDWSNYNEVKVNDCTNARGEDMSRSSDWTGGLQITYYFR